jgi:hypothetical protein
MRSITLAVLSLMSSAARCQTPANDRDTLQLLLAEVHQLRQTMETLTVTSQRLQIALS